MRQNVQTARQATFSRARANEPPHNPRGHAAPATATVEHTENVVERARAIDMGSRHLRSATLPETDILALKALIAPNSKEFSYFLLGTIVKPLDRILKIGKMCMERKLLALLAHLPESGISLVSKSNLNETPLNRYDCLKPTE